jgi:hypothetical protein
MGFSKKNKLVLWFFILGLTLLSCTRIANDVTINNNAVDESLPQETDTPNFFLTEFIETANSPIETPTIEPTATEIVVTDELIETLVPDIAETPTPKVMMPVGNVFMRPFDLVALDFDTPENLEGSHARSGPQLSAVFLEEAPIIDGNILDWDGTAYGLGYLVLGPEFYSGDEDIYGIAMLGWDADNFYLGIQVVDNKFVQTAQGNDIYRGDSLELMLDANLSGDFNNDYLDEDDYQLGISPGNLNSAESKAEAYLWSPLENFGTVDEILIASGFTDVGYTMEIAIPWGVFGAMASEDTQFGFLLGISDNDFVNQNLQQSIVSFAPERDLNDPTGWYTLVLSMPEPVE